MLTVGAKTDLSRFAWGVAFALAMYPAILASISVAAHLYRTAPSNPWVSAIIADGWRVGTGLPLYEPLIHGHAATMYGPGEPLALGLLFSLFGPINIAPELLALSGAVFLVVLGWLVTRDFLRAPYQILVVLSLFAIECQVSYFAEGRPDFPAWAFGFAGLVAAYRATDLRGWIIAAAFIVTGVAFKQTVAMLAPAPIIATLLTYRNVRVLLLSSIPLASVAAFFAGIYVFLPNAFVYMVDVPVQYAVDYRKWIRSLWSLMASAACLWIAIAAAVVGGSLGTEWKRRVIWITASFAIALPASAFTAAKVGGIANSFIPAWFLLLVSCWMLLAPFLAKPRFWATPTFVSLAFVMTLIPVLRGESYVLERWGQGNAEYAEIVDRVRSLEGSVISPEDPTIAIKAGKGPGRSFHVEFDAAGWPAAMPEILDRSLREADYVVDNLDFERWTDLILHDEMVERGFVLEWSNSQYALWRNVRVAD